MLKLLRFSSLLALCAIAQAQAVDNMLFGAGLNVPCTAKNNCSNIPAASFNITGSGQVTLGVIRLWDVFDSGTGTSNASRWSKLDPLSTDHANNTYNWSLIQGWIDGSATNGFMVDYVISQSPMWTFGSGTTQTACKIATGASPDCTAYTDTSKSVAIGACGGGLPATAKTVHPGCYPPDDTNTTGANLNTFTNDLLAKFGCKNGALKGCIGLLEVWNEYNSTLSQYGGTTAQIVAMTKVVHTAVVAWNAANNGNVRVISSAGQGYPNGASNSAQALFNAGIGTACSGAACMDIVAVHFYYNCGGCANGITRDPETAIDDALKVKNIIPTGANTCGPGVPCSSLPVWDTESGFETLCTNRDGWIARDYILHWANGNLRIPVQMWYEYDAGNGHGTSYWRGTPTTCSDPTGVNVAGKALEQLATWLVGSTLGNASCVANCNAHGGPPAVPTGIYKATLTKPSPSGYTADIYWNTDASSSLTIAAGQYQQYRVLSTATPVALAASATSVTIGLVPIMLETIPGSSVSRVKGAGPTGLKIIQ